MGDEEKLLIIYETTSFEIEYNKLFGLTGSFEFER